MVRAPPPVNWAFSGRDSKAPAYFKRRLRLLTLTSHGLIYALSIRFAPVPQDAGEVLSVLAFSLADRRICGTLKTKAGLPPWPNTSFLML
jgi:hypothetical protein